MGTALANTLLSTDGTLGDANDQVYEDDGSFYDTYRFHGQAGQTVTVTLESASFDTYLFVINADSNTTVAANDDIAEGLNTNSSVTFSLPTTGEYIVIANSLQAGETGRYRLSVVSDSSSNNTAVTATTLNPSSRAGDWYVYERPSSITEAQMQIAGARYYEAYEACAQHYSLCSSLSGMWLSTNSALRIAPSGNSLIPGTTVAPQSTSSLENDFVVCMDRLMYRNLTPFDRRFAFPNSIFFFRQPTDVSDAEMIASGLRREGDDWAINGSESVTVQVMTETEAAAVCEGAL